MKRLPKTIPAACLVLLTVVAGCARGPNQPVPSARWVPSAAPSFATLARSTTYALVHNQDRDLLVIEDDQFNERGDFVTGRLTWLVPLPKTPAFEQPMRIGDDRSPAWVLEERQNEGSHGAPARGTVIVHSVSADAVTATVNLVADAQDRTAGVVQQPTVTLDGRYEFVRYAPTTHQYKEMKTRRGVDPGATYKTR